MSNSTTFPRLARPSRIMAQLSLIGAVLTVLMTIAIFVFPDTMKSIGAFEIHHAGADITSAIPFGYRIAALVVEMIPTGLLVWTLLELRRLFLFYARGEVFTAVALRALNRVAMLLFWQVAVAFVAEAPTSVLLTWANPPGHRELSLDLSSHDVAMLFVAGVAFVIARVMAEARRMADENESFV